MMILRVMRLSTHSMRPHSSFKGVTAYVLVSSVVSAGWRAWCGNFSAVLTHASLACLDVSLQEPIDHVVEFHETLVFTQVVLGFAEGIVDFSVRTAYADLAGLLHRL